MDLTQGFGARAGGDRTAIARFSVIATEQNGYISGELVTFGFRRESGQSQGRDRFNCRESEFDPEPEQEERTREEDSGYCIGMFDRATVPSSTQGIEDFSQSIFFGNFHQFRTRDSS